MLHRVCGRRHVTKPNGAPLGAVKLRQEGGTIVANPAGKRTLVPPDVVAARERERFGDDGGGGGGASAPVMSGGGAKRWS